MQWFKYAVQSINLYISFSALEIIRLLGFILKTLCLQFDSDSNKGAETSLKTLCLQYEIKETDNFQDNKTNYNGPSSKNLESNQILIL
jgi:hypothetical protein